MINVLKHRREVQRETDMLKTVVSDVLKYHGWYRAFRQSKVPFAKVRIADDSITFMVASKNLPFWLPGKLLSQECLRDMSAACLREATAYSTADGIWFRINLLSERSAT